MAVKVRKLLVLSKKYGIKCPYSMKAEYITVHNTYNDASAEKEVKYMTGNSNQTSFHIAVDDKEAIQAIPFGRNAWHAGDGAKGTGNRKSIGIEICYSKSGGERFKKAERNAAELIAEMLKERGWGIERVKKHQDWSGKYCPHRTLDLGWKRFINMVKEYMKEESKPVATKPSIYYKKYTGKSYGIDTVLKAIEVPEKFRGKWIKRKPIAEKNGIKDYKGSITQNLKLVKLAKEGKLKRV